MKKRILAIAVMTIIMGSVSAQAGTTLVYNDGPLQNTTGLTGYQTTDTMMTGMTVDVTYKRGNNADITEQYIWGNINVWGAGDGVSDWWGDLNFNGDSFNTNWNLDADYSYSISNIFMDAGAGDAVFDVLSGQIGTSGSADGLAFQQTGWPDFDNIIATYSGAVGLNGAGPVGDLYRYLNLSFDPAFDRRDNLSFKADTDSLIIAGDITPVDPVPEPNTLLLMGFGLAGLVGYARKRSRKNG